MTGISKRFFRLSEGLDTVAGESCASVPGPARSLGLMLFFVMKLMRRTYMYTQTSSVSSIAAKKGPKIAVCAMFLFLEVDFECADFLTRSLAGRGSRRYSALHTASDAASGD